MSRPLAGLRVLDCSLGTAGPQASGLLADYGAEVTWVEPPGGDLTRRLEPASAAVFNRGKRSIVLDVEKAEDRERIAKLAERADVFIEGWTPGQADKLGLGFEALRARNPQLIYCSISGFGEGDSHADLPAYEGLVHAVVGTMAYQAGHREEPIFAGLPFASTGAAQLAAVGILAALHRRFEDGLGRRVETSMYDGALAFHQMLWGESDASLAANATGGATDPRAMLSRSRNRLVTRSFVCGDGLYLGIHTGAVGAFSRLMEVLGLDDRIKPVQGGFDLGTPLTEEESEILESSIHAVFASQPRDYWVKRLMEADVCAVEHLAPTHSFDMPQTVFNGMVVEIDDPVLGKVAQVAPGIRLNGEAPPAPTPAPAPGRDTAETLAALDRPAEPSSWRSNAKPGSAAEDRPLLEGLKVLDLGAYYAGPYSSRVLADFGADVIKLEPTAGDQLRGIERPFFAAQANKRSISANLKSPALRPAIEHLIKWADVVHHNMRPGAAERLGLGAEQVRAVNDKAVYLYAPGWGSSGPFRLRQSFAPMLSGYVGASMEVAGEFNEPMPSVGNEDPGNGLLGAIGLLMALLVRHRSGVSAYCENPQLNAALGMVAHIVRGSDGEAVGAARLDVMQTGVEALESLYETADGWLCVVVRQDDEIRTLQTGLGLDILADDRFNSIEARRENRLELTEMLRETFAKQTTAAWLKAFEGSGARVVKPAGRGIVHELMNDPLQRKLGRVAEVRHAEKGQVRELARLVRISGARLPAYRLAPGLGEHTDEILAWLGYKPEQIAELREKGEIRGPAKTAAAV
ncbi:MAG: CoA transferase [Caulobacteraceae bacterium]|nr:CoA transferase [Caulobacteraceae bacterium]